MKSYFLELVFSGHGEVSVNNTENQEDRWNRFIKFVQSMFAFVWLCVCVSAQTEGAYMWLILIKGSFFRSLSKDNTGKALGLNTLK